MDRDEELARGRAEIVAGLLARFPNPHFEARFSWTGEPCQAHHTHHEGGQETTRPITGEVLECFVRRIPTDRGGVSVRVCVIPTPAGELADTAITFIEADIRTRLGLMRE